MSKLPKLVRDKIPELIRESGNDYVAHADDDPTVMTGWLSKKLVEELEEFRSADENKLEEAGDMLEVCLALWANNGFTLEEVLLAAKKKRIEKGAFKDGIILWDVIYERLE